MLARNVAPIKIRSLAPNLPRGHILAQAARSGSVLGRVERSRAAISPFAKPKRAKASPSEAQTGVAAVKRDITGLSVGSNPIYGCSGLFDLCGEADLMSLSFQGSDPFLDWIGWEATNICLIKKYFVTYVRPEYSGATLTVGYLGDACADPNGVEWGKCDFELRDFARLRRHSPVVDDTKLGLRLCDAQPRYRLDGTPITDDLEYNMRITTEAVLQDLKRMVVPGNAATPGQFNGLAQIYKTGYTDSEGHRCQAMDSIVINWNQNQLSGGSGITWNGAAVGTGFNFIDVLMNAYRNIRQRIMWAGALDAQAMEVGDMVLVLPTAFIDCVLNYYTCWRVCPGQQYNETNLNSLEARAFRNTLMGGMFGAGRIFLHGFEIPILPFDWGLINSPTRFDAYLLTGSVGNVKLLSGQYNDMRYAGNKHPERYAVTDGGRILTYSQFEHTCDRQIIEMQPRLLGWAPWAGARFENLKCSTAGPILSPDPEETSFFPTTSFNGPLG